MKNILVAGGTDGIGLAFVRQLKPKQYKKIFILGRSFEKVEALSFRNLIELSCDITDEKAIHSALRQVNEPVDQFVNTIGTFYRNSVDKVSSADVTRHFALNSVANINLTNTILPKLNTQFAEILVCLATLALEARENYALQAATKAAYKYYLDTVRIENADKLKVMIFYPSSVDTAAFKKAGDLRDTSIYPSAEAVANVMHFMLEQPREIYIPELKVENF